MFPIQSGDLSESSAAFEESENMDSSVSFRHETDHSITEDWQMSRSYDPNFEMPGLPSNKSSKIDNVFDIIEDNHADSFVKPEKLSKKQKKDKKSAKFSKIFVEDVYGLKMEDAYVVDRAKNKNIYKYESIYEGHVPKYEFKSRISVLGLKGVSVFNVLKSQEKSYKNVKFKHKRRYYYKKVFQKLTDKGVKLLSCENITLNSFIELLEHYPELAVNESKAIEVNSECSKLQLVVDKDAKDLAVWFRLLDLQLPRVCGELRDKDLSEKTFAILLNKQLMMIDKMLLSHPNFPKLKTLKIQFMDILNNVITSSNFSSFPASISLSKDVLDKEWAHLFFTYPQNVSIWRKYISYIKSRRADFKVIYSMYKKAINTVSGIICGKLMSHKPTSSTLLDLIDLFAEFCHWLRLCGQSERAFAMWEAVVNFNCFPPDAVLHEAVLSSKCYRVNLPNMINFGVVEEEFKRFWDCKHAGAGLLFTTWSDWHQQQSACETALAADTSATEETTAVSEDGKDPAAAELESAKPAELPEAVINVCNHIDFHLESNFEKEYEVNFLCLNNISDDVEDALMQFNLEAMHVSIPSVLETHQEGICGQPQGASQGSLALGHARTRGEAWAALERSRDEVAYFPAHAMRLTPDAVEDADRCVPFDSVQPFLLSVCLLSERHFPSREFEKQRALQRLMLLFLEFHGIYDAEVWRKFSLSKDLQLFHDLMEVSLIKRQHFLPNVDEAYEKCKPSTVNYVTAKSRRRYASGALSMAARLHVNNGTWQTSVKQLQFKVVLKRLMLAIAAGKLNVKDVLQFCREFGKSMLAQDQMNLVLWRSYGHLMGFCHNMFLLYASLPQPQQASQVKVTTSEAAVLNKESDKVFSQANKMFPIPEETTGHTEDWWKDSFYAQLKLVKAWIDCKLGVDHPVLQSQAFERMRDTQRVFLKTLSDCGKVSSQAPLNQTQLLRLKSKFLTRLKHLADICAYSAEMWYFDLAASLGYLHLVYNLLLYDDKCLQECLCEIMPLLKKMDPTTCRVGGCLRAFVSAVLPFLFVFSRLKQRPHLALIKRFLGLIHCSDEPLLLAPSELIYLLPAQLAQFDYTFASANPHVPYALCDAPFLQRDLIGVFQALLRAVTSIECKSLAANGLKHGDQRSLLLDEVQTSLNGLHAQSEAQLARCLHLHRGVVDLLQLSMELLRWVAMKKSHTGMMDIVYGGEEERVRRLFERLLTPRCPAERLVRAGIDLSLTEGLPSSASWTVLGAQEASLFAEEHLSVVMWRCYMAFEWLSGQHSATTLKQTLEVARARRDRLKAVFYRAIEQHPNCKCLYMDLVNFFPFDIKEIVDLLTQKELRLRSPLEEIDLLLTSKPV